jgi:imidazolonepropionase
MRTRIENLKGLATLRENNQNCDFLAGNSMDNWTMIDDAFIEIDSGLINNYGSMSSCPKGSSNIEIIDGTGRFILPAFIDSHTHLVYANDRSEEFNMRMHGSTYTEIATLGGGILNSSKQIMSSNENQLLDSLLERIEKSKKTGTAALEIKSGYGLTADSERKMLRVIKRAKDQVSQKIWSTFLGAHALPLSYKGNHDAYIEEICNEMLPKFADEGLVDFVDIFCETNYFSPKHIDALCNAANKFNLPLKAHVNQFSSIGGLQAAIKNQAWSVDHLEFMTDQDHQDLYRAFESNLSYRKPIPVALPGCSLFLDIPYTPGRRIIDSHLPLAIASDCNPGSAPSSNLGLCWSLACHKMKLTPKEGLAAITTNAAYALGAEKQMGHIAKGLDANLILTKPVSNLSFIPYSFGENNIEYTFIQGR